MASQSKIHVLHILHKLSVGGAENGVVNLSNRMDTSRFSVGIVSLSPGGKLMERVDSSRVSLIQDLNKQPGNDWQLPFQLAKIFKREHPHIVHSHAWGTLVETWLAKMLARVPIWIHGEHGTMQEKPMNRRIQRMVWGRADQVLSVSGVLADRLSETMAFPRESILPLLNGVEISKFQPKNQIKNNISLRDSLKIAPETKVVGIVGRLEPVKDHESFIKAIAYISNNSDSFRNGNLCALVIGDGALTSSMQELSEELGLTKVVKFLGRRNDVPELLDLVDVSVCSSLSEGMSNTILEAMASGLPVVATNVGGNPELVIEGKTGLLVPSAAPEKLGKALTSLLIDPDKCLEMGRKGKERANNHFTLDGMVKNYEDLYQSFCDKKCLK